MTLIIEIFVYGGLPAQSHISTPTADTLAVVLDVNLRNRLPLCGDS